jgi:Ca2+-binding EF-hand superfamily protein
MSARVAAVALLTAAIFSLAGSDTASGQEKRGKRDFKAFDVNNDGRISPSEWKLKAQSRELTAKQTADRFNAIDTDKDGYLSADEMVNWTQKKAKAKKKAEAKASSGADASKEKPAKKAKKAKKAK